MDHMPPYVPPYAGVVICLGMLVQAAPSGDPWPVGLLGGLAVLQAWLAGVFTERWR